jgi:hypothetical protein
MKLTGRITILAAAADSRGIIAQAARGRQLSDQACALYFGQDD